MIYQQKVNPWRYWSLVIGIWSREKVSGLYPSNLPRVRLIPGLKAQLPWFIFKPKFGPSRDGLLTALVWQRRIRDQRIKLGHKLWWHLAALWTLPEAMIMDVVEKYLVLRSDGFDDQEIAGRICNSRVTKVGEEAPVLEGLGVIIRYHLDLEFPNHPVDLLPLVDHQVAIVEEYFVDHPEELASIIRPCPADWLKHRIVRDEDKPDFSPTANERLWAEWQFMLARTKDDDELWAYSSSSGSWKELMGRGGYALVRNGEPIASLVAEMN